MSEKVKSIKEAVLSHFFDFLMLFLAVTLGFFVDNYRDQYNDTNTVKDLAADLVSDMCLDTLNIHKMIEHSNLKMQNLNSLYLLIDDKPAPGNDSLMYVFTAFSNLRPWFERQGSTYTMLTSAGYLKLFSKKSAAEITRYELNCTKTLWLLEQERSVMNEKIFPFQQHIFHTENFHSLTDKNRLVVKPELHNWTAETRWMYHNYITELKIQNHHIQTQYQQLLYNGRSAIEVLKKEYSN